MSDEFFSFNVALDPSVGPVSAGVHRAKCTKVELKDNKNKNGKNLVLDFEVLTEAEKGRKIRLVQSMLPQVQFKWQPVLQAFGVNLQASGTQITQRDFVGKTVRIQVVADETNEGRMNIENVLVDDAPVAAKPSTPKAAVASLDLDPNQDDDLEEDIPV